MPYVLLIYVQLLNVDIAKCAGQSVKTIPSEIVFPHFGNPGFKKVNLCLIGLPHPTNKLVSIANIRSGTQYFRTPLIKEGDELAFPVSAVSSKSEPISDKPTSENSNNTKNRICQWTVHLLYFGVCCWLGIWLGYYGTLLPPDHTKNIKRD